MTQVFLNVLNRSIAAGWLIGAVLVLRLVLRRSPKWVHCLLWAIVAVRLVCPFSIESVLSLVPSAEVFPEQVISGPDFDIQTGIEPVDVQVNDYLGDHYFDGVTVPTNHGANVMAVLTVVWVVGMIVLGGYAVFRYGRLRRRLETAVRLQEGVFQSETVSSPFVMGILLPKIYLPFGMEPGDMAHVIAHERAHIARRDHWWKPLGYGILVLHWFNPLVWLGYSLFCRDLEMACDERVIRELDGPGRAEYTEALVKCSLDRRTIAACPLAFGEVGVKERVRSVLNYRRPAFWAVAAAVAVCVIAGVCFLTDPLPNREFAMRGDNVSDLYPQGIVEHIQKVEGVQDTGNIYVNSDNFELHLNADFTWADDQTIQYFFYKDHTIRSAQLRIFPDEDKYYVTESRQWVDQGSIFTLRHYLDALKFLPQEEIKALCPDAERYILRQVEEGTPGDNDRVITYTMDGAGEIDGWFIHLELLPLHAADGAYHGTGEEAVELFYGDNVGSSGVYRWFVRTMDSDSIKPVVLSAFPGVTFCCNGYSITARVTDGETGEVGESILLSGMPIWDAYFCDLTGDGLPEICTSQSVGSGMIDERIRVFDYATGRSWELEDRGSYDYSLWLSEADGRLYVDKRTYAGHETVDFSRLVCRDGGIALENGRDFTELPRRFTAVVVEIRDQHLLVEPVVGSRERASASRIEVPMEHMEASPEIHAGDTACIQYDGQLMETYPARVREVLGISIVHHEALSDLRPTVMVQGQLYLDTGRAVPAEIDPSAILGQIDSTVSGVPYEDGQSNFGCVGSDYARFEDGIVVLIDGEWYYFEPA